MSYIDDYLPINEHFEGKCAWMYLDSKGNVTTACGLLLASPTAALALPFQAPAFSRIATPTEIIANFGFVKASHIGYAAAYYKIATSPLLTDEAIESLQRSRLLEFDRALRRDYSGYDSFPDGVKMALLDMDYNLGDEELRDHYPHFDKAVDGNDWLSAAAECGRDTSNAAFRERNEWTKRQFMDALGGLTQ